MKDWPVTGTMGPGGANRRTNCDNRACLKQMGALRQASLSVMPCPNVT
jgi:hypothetical protein